MMRKIVFSIFILLLLNVVMIWTGPSTDQIAPTPTETVFEIANALDFDDDREVFEEESVGPALVKNLTFDPPRRIVNELLPYSGTDRSKIDHWPEAA